MGPSFTRAANKTEAMYRGLLNAQSEIYKDLNNSSSLVMNRAAAYRASGDIDTSIRLARAQSQKIKDNDNLVSLIQVNAFYMLSEIVEHSLKPAEKYPQHFDDGDWRTLYYLMYIYSKSYDILDEPSIQFHPVCHIKSTYENQVKRFRGAEDSAWRHVNKSLIIETEGKIKALQEERESLRESLVKANTEKEGVEKRLHAHPEYLRRQLALKEEKLSQLGLFNFSAKKSLKREISEIASRLQLVSEPDDTQRITYSDIESELNRARETESDIKSKIHTANSDIFSYQQQIAGPPAMNFKKGFEYYQKKLDDEIERLAQSILSS